MNDNEKCPAGEEHHWAKSQTVTRSIGRKTEYTCNNCLALKVEHLWDEENENGEWVERQTVRYLPDPRENHNA